MDLWAGTRFRHFAAAVFVIVASLLAFGMGNGDAVTLAVVKPVARCADLLKVDFTYLVDAPTKLDSAIVVDASGI
jgi:hypothetical protein